ncbi:MAG: hypothetical protein WC827_04435, partial [Candidatus Paceibacterota bacterium]
MKNNIIKNMVLLSVFLFSFVFISTSFAETTLTVSCSANPNSIEVGESTTWSANASGGTGSYTYYWTGTGLYGTSRTVTKSYNSEGTKTARVTVKSGTQTAYADCSAVVSETSAPNFTASCKPNKTSIEIGESIIWTAISSGTYPGYKYTWSGTDSLSGSNSSVTKTYNSSGTKTASVTVKNYQPGSTCFKTITVPCDSVVVVSEIPLPNLTASCSANPNSIDVGQSTTWSANASGGTGSYT